MRSVGGRCTTQRSKACSSGPRFPVPGYAAPQDTIAPATRYTNVLAGLVIEMEVAGHTSTATVPAALRGDFAALRQRLAVPTDDGMLMLGMVAWANLMGAISLELFGHLHNVVDTPGALFDAVVELQADRLFGVAE